MLCCPFCEGLYSLRRVDIDRDYLMFRRSPCSGGPMFKKYLFRSFIQKVLYSEARFYNKKVLCSEGSIFRRSYVQKVLCSDIFD